MHAAVMLLAETCLHWVAAHSSFQHPLLSIGVSPFTRMHSCACYAVTGQGSNLPRLRKGLD